MTQQQSDNFQKELDAAMRRLENAPIEDFKRLFEKTASNTEAPRQQLHRRFATIVDVEA